MRIDKAKIKTPSPTIDENQKKLPKRVSVYRESYKGEYYNISIEKLIPFQNQTRKYFDEQSLKEMAETIKSHGIRQPLTILVSEKQEGMYEIVSGERRWRAAKIIGLKTVPCIIIHSREAAEEIALIENVQRKNLHPLELMQGFQSLLNRGICKDNQEIAAKIGISKSVVSEILGLSRLPENTKRLLLEKGIKSRKILRQLSKAKEQDHKKIIEQYSTEEDQPLKSNVNSNKEKIVKLLNVYLKKEKIVAESTIVSQLTYEQKRELKDMLRAIIDKLE